MLEQLTEQEFNEYSAKHEKSIFFQCSKWGQLKECTGWKYELVGLKDNNDIVAASLLLFKKIPLFNRYICYSPRGFLLNYNNKELLKQYTTEIAKYVKSKKGIFFKINPLLIYQERDKDGNIVEDGKNNKEVINNLKELGYQHTGLTTTYGKDLEPRWISVLKLKGKSLEQIKSDYRNTTRWDVNNSYKHGLELVNIDETRIAEFKELMKHTGERRGFIDRSLSYYEKMYSIFKDNIKIVLVKLNVNESLESYQNVKQDTIEKLEKELAKSKNKESLIKELQKQIDSADKKIIEMQTIKEEKGNEIIVAGGLFMCFGKQVVSLFGASYKEYMKYKGQYFLNHEMIKWALENSYEKYNFYGITGEFNEDSPMYGLFDFKRGFNAEVEELIGEFTYITSPFYNKLYNLMFKIYKIMKKFH